ncbi:Cip2 [Colletotrichum tabaci]|uniref:(4-O-methyl)-D-glucuronate--lignin esterase n=1 Tax=Colletotrichum tabaci TaxID=1209068 RepID=A0AAV9TAP2_9PEZI
MTLHAIVLLLTGAALGLPAESIFARKLGDFPPLPDKVGATLSGGTLNVMVTVSSASVDMSTAVRNPSGSGPFPAIISIGDASIPIPATVVQITFGNDAFAVQNDRGSRAQGLFCDHLLRASTAWLGVTGCSRNGKVAFVVGTLEKRIALMIPQESGSGGSAYWHILDSENSKGKAIQTSGQVVSENVWFSSNPNAWTTRSS